MYPSRVSRSSVAAGDWKFQSPGQPARCSANGSRAASSKPACLTAATLPSPPHWATSRPPGFSASFRRANRRSWSPIQWNVAVETIASTGSSTVELEQVGLADVDRRRQPPPRLLDHRARAVDGDHAAARQPLDQHRGDAAGAAARVEHGLVAVQPQPPQHVAAHRLDAARSGAGRWRRPSHVATYVCTLSHTRASHGNTRRSASSAAREIRSATSAGWLAPAAEHVGGDDVRVGRVRAPDADADAVEVRAAELALERLEAVVAGQAAAEPRADVAERQVDLVVDDEQRGRGRA